MKYPEQIYHERIKVLEAENERLRTELGEAVHLMQRWCVFGNGEDRYNAFTAKNTEQ